MMDATEKQLSDATNDIVIALSKTVSDLYGAIERKHRLTEHEGRLVFGEALLRSASMNLAAANDASGYEMIRLTVALKAAYEQWQGDEPRRPAKNSSRR